MDQLGIREFLFISGLILWLFVARGIVDLALRRFERSIRPQDKKREEQAEKKKPSFLFGGRPAV